MQNAFSGFIRDEFAHKSITCAGALVTEETVLSTVGIGDIEVFPHKVYAAELIEDDAILIVKYGTRNELAVFVVSVHVVSNRMLFRLAAVKGYKQHGYILSGRRFSGYLGASAVILPIASTSCSGFQDSEIRAMKRYAPDCHYYSSDQPPARPAVEPDSIHDHEFGLTGARQRAYRPHGYSPTGRH
jgi:hypothetical protein